MKKYIYLLVLALGMISCSSTQQFAGFVETATPPTEGMAKIHVVRKKSGFASAVKSKIYQEDKLIGKLGNGSYLSWEVQPEATYLVATTENRDTVRLDLEPNKEYFVSLNYKMGFIMARADLNIIDKAEFEEMMGKTKKPKLKQI